MLGIYNINSAIISKIIHFVGNLQQLIWDIRATAILSSSKMGVFTLTKILLSKYLGRKSFII